MIFYRYFKDIRNDCQNPQQKNDLRVIDIKSRTAPLRKWDPQVIDIKSRTDP